MPTDSAELTNNHANFFIPNCVSLPFCHSGCCAGSSMPGHLLPFSPWHPQKLWQIWYHNSHCHYSHPNQIHPSHHMLFLSCACHSCSSWAPLGCRLEWWHTLLRQRRLRIQMLPHGYLPGSEPNDQLIISFSYKNMFRNTQYYFKMHPGLSIAITAFMCRVLVLVVTCFTFDILCLIKCERPP